MIECSRDLRANLVDAPSGMDLLVTLRYLADDPFAVTATIGAERIDWLMSRDLLRDGTSHPAGMGDVCIWPGGEPPDDRLFVYLRAPSGKALLQLSRTAVLDFLRATEILVPSGTESVGISLEDELQELMDGDTH
jgi:hypothetical protein